MTTQDQKSIRVPGGLKGAGVDLGLLQGRSDVCCGDEKGVSGRMGDARRCSCGGAGEGLLGLFLAVLANPVLMLQIRSNLRRQGHA